MNLDTTFTALPSIARPYLQESISEGPPSEELAIREFPLQGQFLRQQRGLLPRAAPGVATLPHSAPILADAFEAGTPALPKTIPMNERPGRRVRELADFSEDPLVRTGVQQLTRLSSSLKPTLAFLTPVQATCNYATLFFRNAASVPLRRRLERHLAALHHLPSPSTLEGAVGPNNEIGPASAPANGPTEENHLHATRIRTRPRRARRASARPATSATPRRAERTIIGNQPGNQGTKTETSPRRRPSTP